MYSIAGCILMKKLWQYFFKKHLEQRQSFSVSALRNTDCGLSKEITQLSTFLPGGEKCFMRPAKRRQIAKVSIPDIYITNYDKYYLHVLPHISISNSLPSTHETVVIYRAVHSFGISHVCFNRQDLV